MPIPLWLIQTVTTVILSVSASVFASWLFRRHERRQDKAAADNRRAHELLAGLRHATCELIAAWDEHRDRPEISAAEGVWLDAFDRARTDLQAEFGGLQLRAVDVAYKAYMKEEHDGSKEAAKDRLEEVRQFLEWHDQTKLNRRFHRS